MNRVGRYEIAGTLGQGGMGTVYKAFDPLLTRVVAVKVISGPLDEKPEPRERFFREARAAARLSHRNIITIYDLGEQDGALYLAMEYLEGRDLDKRLHGPESLSLTWKLEVAVSISEGLAHAHMCGLIHRDIKPANIFVTDDGVVKILDFGLARLTSPEMTRSNVVVGTISYMAPEQLQGERADHRADIFSFGVLLYELLAGRRPFQGDSAAATMHKILHEIPQALDQLDRAIGLPLMTIVDRALAKAPEHRYQQMTDLLRDLKAVYEPMRGAEMDIRSSLTMSDVGAPTNAAQTIAGVPSVWPVGAASRTPLPSRFLSAVWPRWLGTAAILVVVVVAGWLVGSRQTPASVTAVSSTDPAPRAISAPPSGPVLPASDPAPADRPAPSVPSGAPKPRPDPPPARETPSDPTTRAIQVSVERTRATAALSLMEATKAAAISADAYELAPQIYAAAEQAEAQAREDVRQQRFAAAVGRLEATATLFRSAVLAADAERVTRARLADEGRRRAEQPLPPPPVPVPVAPPPRSEPAPSPPPTQPTAHDAVMAILRRYTAALEQRDIDALRLVWPALSRPQQEAVEADFANARSISVELADPNIEVTGGTATVTTVRHYSLRTRDGQQLRSDTATTVSMRQSAGGWLIESVSHRPLP